MVVFRLQFLSRCQRSGRSCSCAGRERHFLIAARAENSLCPPKWAEMSWNEPKRAANASPVPLTFAPPARIPLGGERARVMSRSLLSLVPFWTLFISIYIPLLPLLSGSYEQPGAAGTSPGAPAETERGGSAVHPKIRTPGEGSRPQRVPTIQRLQKKKRKCPRKAAIYLF